MIALRRAASDRWSRPVLMVALLAALAILILAVTAADPSLVAAVAAVACVALGIYAAAPLARAERASVPQAQDDGLPKTARAVLGSLDDPLLVLDRSGRVILANGPSHIIVPDAERKHISSVLRNPDVLEAIRRVLAGGGPESVEFTIPVPVERYFRAYIASAPGPTPNTPLVLVQFHDLTSMRRAEEMRADFVANASHELRTPLAAVSGFIDTLKGHARNDADARERFLDIMSDEAGRMRRLIDDLLSLTRIELNEHNPPAGEVDITAVVRDAAAALAPLAQADGITIDIAESQRLPVIGDRDDLIQVFQNLVHNAIKYGGGKVRIGFGRAPADQRGLSDQVFVAVADNGEGIPREAIPRLTERFYRVDVKRSRERGGTGLGLAIVKHILNRHRARLQIESTPGQGSTFTVYLPAAIEHQGSRQ
jgi:two-component system phosphate regulon sensor histidine kinase PhoR